MVAGTMAIYWEYVGKLFLFLRGCFFFPYAHDNNILINVVFYVKYWQKHIEIIFFVSIVCLTSYFPFPKVICLLLKWEVVLDFVHYDPTDSQNLKENIGKYLLQVQTFYFIAGPKV